MLFRSVLYGSLVLLPIFLQTLLGYPSLQAGIAMSPRGMGSFLAMPLVGLALGRVDARRLLGAGLVGASLALALAPARLRVALVEPRAPAAAATGDAWDSRIYAISPGSAAFLASIGAWQTAPTADGARIARVETMRIFGDAPTSALEFSAYEAGLSELAFIAENGQLQAALWRRLNDAAHVTLHCPAACLAIVLLLGTWSYLPVNSETASPSGGDLLQNFEQTLFAAADVTEEAQ